MWVYAHTDLGDLYRDRLTLRQVWVRIQSLPQDAPLLSVLEAEAEKAATAQQEAELRATLARFQPPKREG